MHAKLLDQNRPINAPIPSESLTNCAPPIDECEDLAAAAEIWDRPGVLSVLCCHLGGLLVALDLGEPVAVALVPGVDEDGLGLPLELCGFHAEARAEGGGGGSRGDAAGGVGWGAHGWAGHSGLGGRHCCWFSVVVVVVVGGKLFG